jgi:hypothetical protein
MGEFECAGWVAEIQLRDEVSMRISRIEWNIVRRLLLSVKHGYQKLYTYSWPRALFYEHD